MECPCALGRALRRPGSSAPVHVRTRTELIGHFIALENDQNLENATLNKIKNLLANFADERLR